MFVGILAATLMGAFNAFLHLTVGIPAFLATLSSSLVVKGIAYWITEMCIRDRATIKKGCKLMVVLKANAYGHGIEQCAIACRNADMFAVATLQEALMIRRTGLRTPVLLLGPVLSLIHS